MGLSRRGFLRALLGTTVVAATNPTYFLAPPTGWRRLESGLLSPNNGTGQGSWSSKTPEEIMGDINAMFSGASFLTGQLELADLKIYMPLEHKKYLRKILL